MFSKSTQYALRAVLYLAVHTDVEHKANVKDIAQALDIPGPFLAKLLQQLSKNRLVSSTKGPFGGFYLSKDNLSAPLLNIINCIDGEETFHSCILGFPVCSSTHPCPLHDKAMGYRNGLSQLLTNNSIADLAEKIRTDEIKI